MTSTNQTTTPGLLRRHQWRLILLGTLIAVAGALAWKYYDSRYPSWYEEVRLSDGRVITIHQKREYFENYGTSQSWVTIDLPELGGKRVWHSYLMPQRVDVVDGKVYVFGIPRGDRQLEYYRYPKHFMVAFVWTGTQFQRTAYLKVPEIARKEENVFRCVPIIKSRTIEIEKKVSSWCEPDGELGRQLNLDAYTRAANRWAEIPRWSAENRSE